jgi:hypothetical protein
LKEVNFRIDGRMITGMDIFCECDKCGVPYVISLVFMPQGKIEGKATVHRPDYIG